MDDLIKNYNSAQEFDYSVHISQEFSFIYFNNPKCGCTTVKATLNMACARAQGRSLVYQNMGEIHDRRHNVLLTPAQVGYRQFTEMLNSREFFKFTVIREPLRRVASAYESKMTWESDIYNRLLKKGLIPEGKDVSFDEFLQMIASDDLIRDIDEHWRLQRKQICYDLVNFDEIALTENLTDDLSKILKHIFGSREHSIFDARTHFADNVSGSGRRLAQLTQAERDLLRRIYRLDFEMYNIVANKTGEP